MPDAVPGTHDTRHAAGQVTSDRGPARTVSLQPILEIQDQRQLGVPGSRGANILILRTSEEGKCSPHPHADSRSVADHGQTQAGCTGLDDHLFPNIPNYGLDEDKASSYSRIKIHYVVL